MFLLLERNKLLVEGSGASSLAALLYKKLNIKGKKVVALLVAECGVNYFENY